MADLLATSPIVNLGNGCVHRRMVLSVIRNDDGSPREFVVQQQSFYSDGSVSFSDGNWMPVFGQDAKEVQGRAWNKFEERAQEDLIHYPLSILNEHPERFGKHITSLTVETGKG